MILGGVKDIKYNYNRMTDIDTILQKNSMDDLQKFIKKRACLNNCNMYLTYIFHLLQTCGMITTTISASYDYKEILWVGIGINALASLINIYEKINKSISNKMLENIKSIKAGNYLDESNDLNEVAK